MLGDVEIPHTIVTYLAGQIAVISPATSIPVSADQQHSARSL